MAKPNDQQGLKLPVPGKTFAPLAHDGGIMKNAVGGRATVIRFTSQAKSPARATYTDSTSDD